MTGLNAFFLFVIGGVLFAVASYRAVKGAVKKIGHHPLYYPRRYISTPKLFQRIYKFNQVNIPKYIVFHCCTTLIFFSLGPIELLIHYLNPSLALTFLFVHYWFGVVEKVVFLLFTTIFSIKRFTQK